MVLTGQTTPRASEGGHWYHRDGTPCYEVPAKDGSPRACTLRDARKMGLYPGITTIIRCAAAPGLEIWKQKQVLLAALTLPTVAGETTEALLERVMSDSQEEGRKARDRGTEIHAAIQGHYEGLPPNTEFWPYVQGVSEAIKANFGEWDWVPEKACAHPLGYGTKADLSVYPGTVLDFKGSEFTEAEAPALKTWDEHAMQLAATREALLMPGATCAIVYVSRNVPGLCRIIHIDEPELQRGWDMFRGLLNYWKASKGYWPELWKPVEKVAA